MRVYMQDIPFGRPIAPNMRNTEYWFQWKGYEIIKISHADLMAGVADEHLHTEPQWTIMCGGIGFVLDALRRVGRPVPQVDDFPESVRSFAGRRVWEGTLSDVRRMVSETPEQLPVHVKPRDHAKLFVGVVVRAFKDLIQSANVKGEEPVLVQEVVNFVSEWRATILRGKILNVSHYKGDPLKFPDATVMQAGLDAFSDRPIGCAMDWGVTDDGRTLLVEVNDGFALGNYGVPGTDYVRMIEARWMELMGLPDLDCCPV